MAAAAHADPAPATGGGAATSPFWNVLVPVLTFIGTGIGIIGFVIFFGGFVVWARFDGAGLPANEAVAELPRNELVVTGASFLIPAMLAALAAVTVALVLWDAVVGNRRRGREAGAEGQHKAALAELEMLNARAGRVKDEIARSRAALDRYDREEKDAEPRSAARNDARQRYDDADGEYRKFMDELSALQEDQIPEAAKAERDANDAVEASKQADRVERLLQIAVGGIPLLLAGVIIIVASWGVVNWGQRLLLFVVLVTSLAVATVVVTLARNFAWFALCVFLGVAILMAFASYARAHGARGNVSAVAAIDGATPVTGFFVAETSDAVYVAQPGVGIPASRSPKGETLKAATLDRSRITLVRIPKKELNGLTVGPLMRRTAAYRRSLELALGLCGREKPAPATAKTAKSSKAPAKAQLPSLWCSSKDIAALKATMYQL